MTDWAYEWRPAPGLVATLFGPTDWGWFYDLDGLETGRVEGIAETRLGALDAVARAYGAPSAEASMAQLREVLYPVPDVG